MFRMPSITQEGPLYSQHSVLHSLAPEGQVFQSREHFPSSQTRMRSVQIDRVLDYMGDTAFRYAMLMKRREHRYLGNWKERN